MTDTAEWVKNSKELMIECDLILKRPNALPLLRHTKHWKADPGYFTSVFDIRVIF